MGGVEADLDRAEERADTGETKIIELEEELRVVGNNLKSLEVSEEKANQREEHYKEQIKHLTWELKQAEARAEFAERSVQKLQKEVDRLEDELVHEKEKFKAVSDELDQTFAEMSGYYIISKLSGRLLKTKTPICHAHFFTLSAGLFLISLFSTTLHKLLVTLPANPCLSKLLSEFEKYLPNFKEQVAFFSPNKKCSSLIKPPNFVSSKISSVTVFTEVVAMISSISYNLAR